MIIKVEKSCPVSDSYRAAVVRSLFNADNSARFEIEADLPIEGLDWQIGLIVGSSGSGKSTLGAEIWGQATLHRPGRWPRQKPVIDVIKPRADFETAARTLSAAGLGSIPAWLRPHHVLSTGEKFRAEMARILATQPERTVIDEFTSVVDRPTARTGSAAFSKAWRKGSGQVILLTCHADIIPWLCPDWIYDTDTAKFREGEFKRPPKVRLTIRQVDWSYWPRFEPHHYLKLPLPIASYPYVAFAGETPVAHVAMSTRPGLVEGWAKRFVVMPQWQGIGVGVRVLESVALMWRKGQNPYGKPLPTLINTSHPGLAAALRRRPGWYQVSAHLYGTSKKKVHDTINRSRIRHGRKYSMGTGFGGHFRATQGFRFLGE